VAEDCVANFGCYFCPFRGERAVLAETYGGDDCAGGADELACKSSRQGF